MARTRLLERIHRWLEHPLTSGRDLDDPKTTALRRQIIDEKRFLRLVYAEWYAAIAAALPPGSGPLLEIGSGPGFMAESIPELITSDVLPGEGLDLVLDARWLPLDDRSLRGIVMTDVLHHVPDVTLLFEEALRTIRPGGVIVMVEPWVTPLSRFLFTHLQREPLDTEVSDWLLPAAGPLSGANLALPWILFCRDRQRFSRTFPGLQVQEVRPLMPVRYLLSGGIGTRVSPPAWMFGLWRAAETAMEPWMQWLAMFALIRLSRQ